MGGPYHVTELEVCGLWCVFPVVAEEYPSVVVGWGRFLEGLPSGFDT